MRQWCNHRSPVLKGECPLLILPSVGGSGLGPRRRPSLSGLGGGGGGGGERQVEGGGTRPGRGQLPHSLTNHRPQWLPNSSASEPLEGLVQCRLPGPTESLTHLGWDQGISFPESSQGCCQARTHALKATVLFKSDLQASLTLLQGLCCG